MGKCVVWFVQGCLLMYGVYVDMFVIIIENVFCFEGCVIVIIFLLLEFILSEVNFVGLVIVFYGFVLC